MKKIIIILIGLLLLAGCSENGSEAYEPQDEPQEASEPTVLQAPSPNDAAAQTYEWNLGEDVAAQTYEWTLDEDAAAQTYEWALDGLAATIVAVGELWEDWWHLHGVFSWQYFDTVNYELPGDLLSRGFSRLRPSYGLSDFDDARQLLSEFYTQGWIDNFLESERVFFDLDGELLIHTARYGTVRPNWETATHTLIETTANETTANRAIVETKVTAYDHRGSGDEMPTATLEIVFLDGKIDSGLDNWIMEWEWNDDAFMPPLVVWESYAAEANGTMVVIDHANHVNLESFDALHVIDHSIFWYGDSDEEIIIFATQPIYNASLVYFTGDWDGADMAYSVIQSHNIAAILTPGEGLHILNYVSLGTLPWSGISFYDADGKQHFFSMGHDTSDSPHWFLMMNITDQMQ